MKHKPEAYRHIRAWGKMQGSYEYYIKGEQQRASEENAPLDAIYKGSNGWAVFADVANADTLRYFRTNFPELVEESNK